MTVAAPPPRRRPGAPHRMELEALVEALIEEARQRARRRRRIYGAVAAVAVVVGVVVFTVFEPGGRAAVEGGPGSRMVVVVDGRVVVHGVRSCLAGEGGCDIGVGMAVQEDGAVVLAGGTLEGCRSRFAVARVRGRTLDRTFGGSGRVVTGFGSSSAVANTVAIAADGSIVAAGELGSPPFCADHIHMGGSGNGGAEGFALAHYRPDGTLDTGFGRGGTVVTRFDDAAVSDVLLQPDGKIVVVSSSSGRIALARYTRDGELDRSFGRGGTVVSQVAARGFGFTGKAALDRAGRIIVPYSPSRVVRYTGAGSLEHTFVVPLQLATAARVSGRQILVAGMQEPNHRLAVARLRSGFAGGSLDRRFGRNGVALLPTPASSWMTDLAIQKDGRLVLLGTIFSRPFADSRPRDPDFALTRLLPDGSLDRTFAPGGTTTVDVGAHGSGQALEI